MDKLEKYREYVQTVMTRYASGDKDREDVKVELIMDTARDHYQWMNVGWKGMERIYNCYIHIDIIDGKVWLQQNWTEDDLAADLVEMGVPREDIVLGLHAPYKRPYTDYGVA
jgi:XisI protein